MAHRSEKRRSTRILKAEMVAACPISEGFLKMTDAMRTAYLRRHPDAFWVDFGDFRFIHIKPKYVRYVSGVATALLGSGEFDAEEYKAAKVDPISQFSVPIAEHEGYPSGSMVDFACDHDGSPILAVSSLAVHSKKGVWLSDYELMASLTRGYFCPSEKPLRIID